MEKLKLSYSNVDNSAVSKDRAVRFALFERAFRAANSLMSAFQRLAIHRCSSDRISIFDDKSVIFSTDFNVPFTKMAGLLRPNLPEQPQRPSYSC
jgi:hypothetical protein